MSSFSLASTVAPTSPTTGSSTSVATGGGNTPSLFPCLVCYPGTSNYTLVWLPIDPTTINPSLTNISSAALSPQKSTPPLTISSTTTATPLQQTFSPPPSTTSSSDSPSVNNNNPLLPGNLSAAITQSYLQLLQLQQLQQQALHNQPKQESLLPHPSSMLTGTTNDILTQAIAGSIPAATVPNISQTTLKGSVTASTHSSG